MTSAVVVGSGPNGLAAAVTLAAAGVSVTVLEAAERPGGGTRSAELTLPGLVHDECSAFHPLALETAFTREFDLGRARPGVVLAGGAVRPPARRRRAVPRPGSRWSTTAAALGADGRAWQAVFGKLAERFDGIAEDFFQPMMRVPGHPLGMARFGAYSSMPISVLARRWRTPEARALFAGVAAHGFRQFSAPMSSAIGVALGSAGHRWGWPAARGGSAAISDAMIALLADHDGFVETGVRVTSLEQLGSPDIVMLDLAPGAAADVAGSRLPGRVGRALRRYRHGPGSFKVDFAVAEGVPWTYEPARSAGTIHAVGGYDEVAEAERAINRGRMPERPFVLVGQQYVADPTRSRDGVHPVYAYAHVPSGWTGDVTEALTAQIERFAPGFRERILATHVRSVPDMEAHNANYIGGDVVTGANTPRQLVARPRLAPDPYWLGADGLYLCSAATPPGGGAHGMCGFNAANAALRRLERG